MTPLRRALGLLGAAVVLLAVAWLVRSARSTAPAESAAPLAHRGAESGRGEAALSTPADSAAPAESARVEAAEVAGVPETAQPERQLVLRVVDGPHGRAVAGAQVRFADDPELYGELSDYWESAHSDFDGFERLIERRSRVFVADAAGEVRVGCRRQHALALASAPELWGWATVDPQLDTAQEIVLLPDAELAVKVIDPAGAPVAGLKVYVDNGADDFDSGREHTLSAVTAADGTVRMSHVRWWMESEPGRAVVLSVEALLAEPVRIALDRERLPREPVVIVLPFTGSVEVVQKDERDEERLLAYTIELVDVPDSGLTDFELGRRLRDQGLYLSSNEPRARFAFVETGLTVQASGTIHGTANTVLSTRGSGPRSAGERVELMLGGSALLPVLVGRALDPEGAPLRSESMRVAFEREREGSTAYGTRMLSTDGEGRFRIVLDPVQFRTTRQRLSLLCWIAQSPGPIDVDLDLAPEYSPGVHDLGDVRLTAPPLAVAGIVVDDASKPVEGATISLSDHDPLAPRRSFDWLTLYVSRTNARGEFAVRGRGASSEVGVNVAAAGFASPPPVRVARGAQDVRIVLTRGAAVSGEILIDARVQPADLAVSWLPADPPGSRPAHASSTGVQRDGKFELTYLDAGVGRVEVSLVGQPALRAIESVVARAGETTRLEPIDLRNAAFFTLELRTPVGGLPDLGTGAVHVRRSGAASAWWEVGHESGRVVLSAGEGPLDVIAAFEGWRLEQLDGLASDRKLVLRPGIPLAFTIAPVARMSESALRLGIELAPPPEGSPEPLDRFAVGSSATFDAHGLARALVGLPGRWRLEWHVEVTTADSRSRERIATTPPRWLDVADAEADQAVALELPPEVSARWAELRAR